MSRIPDIDARTENVLTLAAALGLDEEEASHRLQTTFMITYEATDNVAIKLARYSQQLLSRFFEPVAHHEPDLEIVIGAVSPRLAPEKRVHVHVEPTHAEISRECEPPEHRAASLPPVHSTLLRITACYVAAAAAKIACGPGLGGPMPNPAIIDFASLTGGRNIPRSFSLEPKTYLAGAGAIGNAILWALQDYDVSGELHIVDPKKVRAGGENRCLWFTAHDVGSTKAERLCQNAQASFPLLDLVPRVGEFQRLPERGDSAWVPRLIVGVDSRGARRTLQGEMPAEVFDASTTGITEVVLHHNIHPFNGACMGCVYKHIAVEESHERHVAELLGVELADVRRGFVDEAAALRIELRHPEWPWRSLVGLAYDTLFKVACGIQLVRAAEDRQVLAPFSFVPALAGTLLVLTMAFRLGARPSEENWNYWGVSPWYPPITRRRAFFLPDPSCHICGNKALRKARTHLWAHLC